jgi:hypothetical protein
VSPNKITQRSLAAAGSDFVCCADAALRSGIHPTGQTACPSLWKAADVQGRAELPNLSADRAFAFAASSSRFLGDEFVCSERRSRLEISAISSTAASNGASFVFDGLLKPLIFLTN